MRHPRVFSVVFLIPALASALAVASAVSTSESGSLSHISSRSEALLPRDGGHGHGAHGHHAQPILELNETEVTMYHAPTGSSYYWIDIMETPPEGGKRYPGLMGLHALFMSLAFFGALPIGASSSLLQVDNSH